MLTPRPHQEPIIAVSLAAFRKGVRRQVLHLATGAGKTPLAAMISAKLDEMCQKQRGRRLRVLCLAHREELLDQMAETMARAIPDVGVTVMQGPRKVDTEAQIIVASALTACHRIPWLQTWCADGFRRDVPEAERVEARPDLLVVDECHHYAKKSKSFVRTLDAFPKSLRLGLSATIERADKKGLNTHFDEVVYAANIAQGIREGWLCDLRARLIRLRSLDLSAVRVRHGDYVENDLAAVLNREQVNRDVVTAWKTYAQDRLTLVFAVNVAHAHDIAATFRSEGILARAVDGTTPTDERKGLFADFRAARFQVLVNCMVATEGVDVPEVTCVAMVRPTKSKGLFQQSIGRGTRIAPGKYNCLILDYVSGTTDHADVFRQWTTASLFGFEPKCYAGVDVQQSMSDDLLGKAPEMKSVEEKLAESAPHKTSDEFDPLARPPRAKLQWAAFTVDDITVWVVAVGRYGRLLVEERVGGYVVHRQHKDGSRDLVLGDLMPYDEAFGRAEDLARKCSTPRPPDGWLPDPDTEDAPPDRVMMDPNAAWRQKPASDRQIERLKKWGIKRDGLTAGEASALIDAEIAKRDSKPASAKQKQLLRVWGVPVPDDLTSRQAARLIGERRNPNPNEVC